MRDHMGFATKSAVYRVIDCLEMRGYVARVRLPGRAGPGRPSSYKPAGRQSLMVLDVVP
jgi:DNA-binding MarR family transcriptional regulator